MHRYLAGCMVLGSMHPMCASEKSLSSGTDDIYIYVHIYTKETKE